MHSDGRYCATSIGRHDRRALFKSASEIESVYNVETKGLGASHSDLLSAAKKAKSDPGYEVQLKKATGLDNVGSMNLLKAKANYHVNKVKGNRSSARST